MISRENWTPEEFAGRWSRLQQAMAVDGIDGMMAGEATNFFYLTGHESTQFLHRMRPLVFLLPQSGQPVIFVYAAEVPKLAHLKDIAVIKGYVDVPFPFDDLVELVRNLGWAEATIGAEIGPNQRLGMSLAEYVALQQAFPGARWVDGGRALLETQAIKTEVEIGIMRKACEISVLAWDQLLERIHPGVTTDEINRQLSLINVELGADPNEPFSAHSTHLSLGATDGVLRPGDMLKCDFHSRFRGYQSDLCRLATVGEPTPDHIAWHAAQYGLLMECIEMVRPGLRVGDIALHSNRRLVEMGQTPLHPIKRIGHGIGIETTSPPSINTLDDMVLQAGMTIAVEPRITVEIGALLLEESVLVTETGYDLLTSGAGTLGVIR